MSQTAVINKKVRDILALDGVEKARIEWHDTGFSKSQILRVITDKWRKEPIWKRVFKLQTALESNLTPKEWDSIFRVSVLTPDESKRLKQAYFEPVASARVSETGKRSKQK